MTCIDNHNFDTAHQRQGLAQRIWNGISAFLAARAERTKQKRDRAAFMSLIGKESWIYSDLGIHEGDVLWASKLPIDVNAAKELEKIRLQNRKNL